MTMETRILSPSPKEPQPMNKDEINEKFDALANSLARVAEVNVQMAYAIAELQNRLAELERKNQ
jgi:hypothetical protein